MGAWNRRWEFLRPFTLLVPAIGMLTGALVALGSPPEWASDWGGPPWRIALRVFLGACMAAIMNGYSNGINQIFDIEIDRINKPRRPLPSGSMSLREAWGISLSCLALAMALAASVHWQTLLMAASAAFLTTIYSAPPLRTKGRGIWANITIAIPRGTLLIVAGWSCLKDAFHYSEPWLLGGMFGLFFLGAATTKDFSDIEGDRQAGCRTLPVIVGIQRSVYLITPFFVLPFLGLLAALGLGYLSGNPWILSFLGVLLTIWGGRIAWMLLRTAQSSGSRSDGWENHPSWKHMYLLTLTAQMGLVAAYLIPA